MTEVTSSEGVPAGTIVAQRYRVVKRVGTGGMGDVYLVQHVHTDERFALKVLRTAVITGTNALERFRREARTPARIDSEHVVRVTDADAAPELKGAPFLVMEYLRGEDLDAYIEKNGALSREETVVYLRQAARALDKAHALGIVHRDLKPENIFITQREDGTPHVKILDFGIAKFTSGATSDLVSNTATNPGEIFGTPLYMSPEQARGDTHLIAAQTDIWALGLIAHKMLTGSEYWTATTLTALIAQVVYEPMQSPSEKGCTLGEAYDAWLLKCCDRDPTKRFSTAGAMVHALAGALGLPAGSIPVASPSLRTVDAFAETSSVKSNPLSKTDIQLATTGRARTLPPSRSLAKVVVVSLLVGSAFGAALYFLQRPPDERPPDGATANVDPNVANASPLPETTVSPAPPETAQASAAVSAQPVPPASATVSASSSASAAPTTPATTPGRLVPRPPPTAKPTHEAASPPTATPTTSPTSIFDNRL